MHQSESTNVTIFTDMSLANGLLGWAFYIRSDYAQIKQAGCMPFESNNNTYQAEMITIGKALKFVKASHAGKKVNKVYIYCDNQGCIDTLSAYSQRRWLFQSAKMLAIEFNQRLKVFLDSLGYVLEPRKVKGHTAGKCIRTRVNNWMDGEARRARINMQNKLGGYEK